MIKKIKFLLIAASFSILANAQVKTNFNNIQKLTEKGRFIKEYKVKPFEIAAPDLTEALRLERNEESLGSKVFYIAQPVSVDINVGNLASWVSDDNFHYGKFTLTSKGAKTLSINFSSFCSLGTCP